MKWFLMIAGILMASSIAKNITPAAAEVFIDAIAFGVCNAISYVRGRMDMRKEIRDAFLRFKQ
ncbi:hypothetical protein [Pararhodobacter zhoushanensis]|uniref:hypothetical protein n=1 Tax=Pararhodobacter zhoushanensis TaxID=2479545 RepID=UPI000F8F3D2F|nr:hypothetical protein [Pararhodobacter zhoushanensis]